MPDLLITALLVVLNLACSLIAAFLIWLYYKWDQDSQCFSTLSGLLFYQVIFFELSLIGNKIILSLLFIAIFHKIAYEKCKKITADHKRERLEEAKRTLRMYQMQAKQKNSNNPP